MNIWRMVTNAAITTMKTGIRTMSGVIRFIHEITKLVQINTAIVAKPIERPLMALVVVAKVGHMPRSKTKVGFSLMSPLIKIFILLILAYPFFTLEAPLCASAPFEVYAEYAWLIAFRNARLVMVLAVIASTALPDLSSLLT